MKSNKIINDAGSTHWTGEPLGGLLAFTLSHRFMSGSTPGVLTAGGAGFMVFIALDGLLHATGAYGKCHHSLYGILTGMLIAAALALI